MSWAKAALAPLAGTIIGGLIALGSSWIANYELSQKDYAAERRQKLETIIADVFESQACTDRMLQGENVSDTCEADTAGYQSMAYAKIYFPDIYKPVGKFQLMQATLRNLMLECMAKATAFDKVSESDQRLKCLKENLSNPERKNGYLDAIIDKAQEIELTIAPRPSALDSFRSLLWF
jgi:hypothetical protein